MEYTLKDVAEHKRSDDAWMVIHGQVYDVTKYLRDHPGGAEVLADTAGTDASVGFDDAGHSEDAFDIMADFCIGKLKGFKKPPPKAQPQPAAPRKAQRPETSPPAKSSAAFKLAGLGLLSTLGAASCYGIGQHAELTLTLPKSVAAALKVVQLRLGGHGNGFGFLKGISVGAGAVVVLGAIMMQRVRRLLKSSKTYASYPTHFKAPQPIQDNLLLARGWLDPVNYSKLPLAKKTTVGPNVLRLTFELPAADAVVGLPTGQHVAIQATVEGESVSRSYTPVSNNHDRGILELVIKVYPDGKLTSGYFAKLKVGDEVSFRGPKGAMRYAPGMCKKIGMVAGGTGITPMYQLIRAICEDDRDTTEISLIYANRTEEDILLRKELDTFARRYPKNFRLHYLLDHPPANWEFGSGFVTKEIMEERLPGPGEGKVLLCGPPGMIKGAKASLGSLGFDLPGASSKMSDQVFVF